MRLTLKIDYGNKSPLARYVYENGKVTNKRVASCGSNAIRRE